MTADAVETLQAEVRRNTARYQSVKRNKQGPFVANADSLKGTGLYVGYGVNSQRQRVAAIFRDGKRVTSWARI